MTSTTVEADCADSHKDGGADSPSHVVLTHPGPPVPDPPPAQPLWRRRWFRVLLVRIAVRLTVIGAIIGIGFVFSVRSIVNKYSSWIHGFHPQAASALLFLTFASVFAGVTPGVWVQPQRVWA